MGLNWTIEVFLNLLSVIPFLLSVWILVGLYRKHRDRIILFLSLTWSFYGVYWLTNALSYLFLNLELYKFNKIFLVLASYSILVSLDYMNSEKIEPIKLAIFTLISGALLYSVIFSDSVEETTLDNGNRSLANIGANRIMISVLAFAVILIYLFYTYKVYLNASPIYRRFALLQFLGSVIFGPVVLFLFAIQLDTKLPGSVPLVSGIGVLMSTIALAKSPQLIYTLPFTIYSLEVIEEKSGLVIFNYKWDQSRRGMQEELVGASLEGINMFARQALKLGNIKEIVLETGIVILNAVPDTNYYATLLSSRSSPVLRENLRNFVKLFANKFHNLLSKQTSVKEITAFDSAKSLIPVAFPYIPAYNL